MDITFWGTRGSIATAGPSFQRFGGNTTCIEITHGAGRIIIDAGTGLRGLGEKLMAEARSLQKKIRASFLFTHLHWDHIQGFPFFAPGFRPDTELELFGPSDESGTLDLEHSLDKQMTPPNFPVPLGAMRATKVFHTIGDGATITRDDFSVKARALTHPQGSLGYRIEAGGKVFCFATDVEHLAEGIDPALLELARGADLFVYDAQYTTEEYEGKVGPCRKGWGHSTYAAAAEIAKAAGVKALGLFHHDPTHDDAMVEAIEHEARTLFLPTFATREGTTVCLG
ncbi:MAG: MBL fold metallo-hydrolase [Myxococcota bacterium]